jgi:hypothetical protein
MVVDRGRSFIFNIENQNFSPSNVLEILRDKSDLRDQPLDPGSGPPIFSFDLYDREPAPPIRCLDVPHNCGRQIRQARCVTVSRATLRPTPSAPANRVCNSAEFLILNFQLPAVQREPPIVNVPGIIEERSNLAILINHVHSGSIIQMVFHHRTP